VPVPTISPYASIDHTATNKNTKKNHNYLSVTLLRCATTGSGELPANLKSITLPAHSPELNPVEKFWDIVKDSICNTAWPTLEAFQEKITVTLRNIGNIPAESCLFFEHLPALRTKRFEEMPILISLS
jgi:hypothetical protein